MKHILILATLSLIVMPNLFAQNQKAACCMANAQFAMLGEKKEFRENHELPRPYVHADALGEMIKFSTPDGKKGSAYMIEAAEEGSEKVLFVIHEWWGLNDHIKREADAYRDKLGESVTIMALDLYDGKVATTREDASKYMQEVNQDRANAIIQGAIEYVGEDAEIATVGWCFGGGWSLEATLLAGSQAAGCVIYYGMPEMDPERLKTLSAPVLGIFATKDGWITPDVVGKFQSAMKEAERELTIEFFEADHAFANPSSEGYRQEAALSADDMTTEFLRERLVE